MKSKSTKKTSVNRKRRKPTLIANKSIPPAERKFIKKLEDIPEVNDTKPIGSATSQTSVGTQPTPPSDFCAPQLPPPPARKSQPYCIRIKSFSDNTETIELFGAHDHITDGLWDKKGSLIQNDVKISCPDYLNISYRTLLFSSLSKPFMVGQMYMQGNKENGGVWKSSYLKIKSIDPNGTLVEVPVICSLDPYQVQPHIIVDSSEYAIDGFTKIILQIPPQGDINLRLYPSMVINPISELTGGSEINQYRSPGIIR